MHYSDVFDVLSASGEGDKMGSAPGYRSARLESEDLELIRAVVSTGTVRATSAQAHLSQPAITRRIQGVEARLGVKLFERAGRKLKLTPAGEEFLQRSAEILDRLHDLESQMGAFGRGQRGILKIGATVTVCLYLLPRILKEMRSKHPEYELFLVNQSSSRMPGLVREGAVDVGIASIRTMPAGLHVMSAMNLHLGLLHSGKEDEVSIRSLEAAPVVMSSPGSLRWAVENALTRYEVHPRVTAESDSLEVLRVLVSAGFGSAIAPYEVMQEDATRSGLRMARFTEPTDPLRVACFYQRATLPVEAFLELWRERQEMPLG